MANLVVCLGCGSNWTDDDLAEAKRRDPSLLSCCPERRMVPGVWCKKSNDVCFSAVCMARGIEGCSAPAG